jgi:recombination protein RecA
MAKKPKEIKDDVQKQGFKIKLASEIKESPKVKTGLFSLDYVLDGGIYQGEGGHRIEFYGKESSGKTTFTTYIIKRFQELGKKCIFINAEQSYDKSWGEKIGVDNSKLHITEPESLEQAGNMLVEFIPKYDLIIVDSIPSLIPQEELDGTLDDKNMASQAKVMSPMTRKLYSATKSFSPVIIFINQLREKVGVMYGNPIDTPGGRALKHFYNTRIEFKLGKPIREGDEKSDIIGYEILLSCKKNKRGRPYRVAEIDFYFNGHIDNTKSLFYAGMKYGIITKQGSYYSYKDIKEQGYDKFVEILKDKDWVKIEDDIWKAIK